MKKLIAVAIMAAMGAVYASNGLKSISDVRVAPFMGTHWGQKTSTGYSNIGGPCFNYYTPNNYHSGCTAAAMAQIMRYDKFPASAPDGEYLCAVDTVAATLTIGAGNYDWDNMPLDTRDGATEEQCQAIGKLTYDCAVAMHTQFGSTGSFAYSGVAFAVLTDTFGYDNAIGYCSRDGDVDMASMQETLFANFDMKRPVMLQLFTDEGIGHQVVADGYGFEGGVPYVHILFGWPQLSDECDGWYPLPSVDLTGDASYTFTKVATLIYNIFPSGNFDILSGRVTDANGAPVSNAVVNLSYGTSTSKKSGTLSSWVETDENGIYAFALEGGKTYTVSCGEKSRKVSVTKSVCANCKWTDVLDSPSMYKTGTLGNSWGNDFVIGGGSDPTPDPTPDPVIDDELGVFNPAKAISAVAPYCGVACKADGSVCGTMSLKIGKASKKGISKVSGTVMTLDGKKYSIASTAFEVNKMGSRTVEGIVVKKLGTVDLTVGEKGFVATIKLAGGELWDAATADLSLPAGTYTFKVDGLPEVLGGYQVLTNLSANGQSVAVSAKGKMDCGKAASIKYKKVDNSYVLWGTDDPKRPNLSGLKLTYTAKTGVVKGSFYIYANAGTDVKPKLKKTKATVYGLSVDGKVVGTATVKGESPYAISIE